MDGADPECGDAVGDPEPARGADDEVWFGDAGEASAAIVVGAVERVAGGPVRAPNRCAVLDDAGLGLAIDDQDGLPGRSPTGIRPGPLCTVCAQ